MSLEPLDGVWLYAYALVGRSGLHPLAGRLGSVGVLRAIVAALVDHASGEGVA